MHTLSTRSSSVRPDPRGHGGVVIRIETGEQSSGHIVKGFINHPEQFDFTLRKVSGWSVASSVSVLEAPFCYRWRREVWL